MSRFMMPKPYVNPVAKANETLAKSGTPRIPNGRAIDVAYIAEEFCKLELMYIDGLKSREKPLLGLFVPLLNAIMIEDSCIEVRQRFTIAHEIGHVQLEHGHGNANPLFELNQAEIFGCTEDDESFSAMDELKAGLRRKKEIRANQFAAHLLMPEGLVREVWREENGDRDRIAAILIVSKEALGYRLTQLRLT
jgi:Zn-dependent peptidase ImmA (M78 family)